MEDVKEGKAKAEGLAVSSPNSLISILISDLVEVGEADVLLRVSKIYPSHLYW